MARTLAFTADNFEVVYEGLLNTNRGFDAPSETRIVGKILEKLEDIAEQVNIALEGQRPVYSYRLADGKGRTCMLSDEEYKLLLDAVRR